MEHQVHNMYSVLERVTVGAYHLQGKPGNSGWKVMHGAPCSIWNMFEIMGNRLK